MRLIEALNIRPREIITLVGAGGKTTLMFALARELVAIGASVTTTTTTKILKPSVTETPLVLLETDEEKMLNFLSQNLGRYRHITLATESLSSGKLKGVTPEFITKLEKLERASHIIVEADGAACRSLKAPNATEPVVPQNTSLLIPVVGIDALGCLLSGEHVHRPEIVSRLTGLAFGCAISAETIAILVTHSEGIIKGSPSHIRIIPVINKVDTEGGLPGARGVAHGILERKHPQIEQVILAQVRFDEPVIEVISTLAS